jgi:cytochrome P450
VPEMITDRAAERPTRAGAPPGPIELPLVGSALTMVRDPLGFLTRISRRHGDVVRFRLPGHRIYLFNDPAAIEQMLVTERDRLVKDATTRELSLVLGNGLLVSEGAFWRKQRRLAQPAFHRQRVDAYGAVMVDYAARAADAWRDGEVRDLHRDMMRLTLDVVAKTLFGVEIAAVARRIEWALEALMDRFAGLGIFVPMGVPTPGNRRAKRAIAELDAIVYGIVRERRAGGDRGDLISMLLAATSDEDGAMDDRAIRDEAITLLTAGHETTALTLTFAFYLLGTHPAAAERLAAEIRDVLGDRPATAADLPRLRYAEAVVRESMRLYPPAWAIGREAVAPCTVGGFAIAPGTQLWAAQWVVHRDARWFPEPEAFRPERWERDLAKTLPRYAYFPFGGGPRVCIGNAFAMMEAVLILVTLARRFRFTPVDRRPLELVPSVTLRPRHGLRVVCSARPGVTARTAPSPAHR